MAAGVSGFKWLFHRLGGLDQVEFRSGEDICRLRELDPKLWVALSCPARGLEFDARTLALIDIDRDGRIRIPEVTESAEWLCARLREPGDVLHPEASLPLDAIENESPRGKRLVSTAEAILATLGKAEADAISQDDVTQAAAHASEQVFNGDGILPVLDCLDEDMRAFIRDVIDVSGGVEDVGGEVGVNEPIAQAFMQSLKAWSDWTAGVAKTETPLGKSAPEIWELVRDLKDKVDDYFMRCELVAYAPAAQDALNLEDRALTDATGLLEHSALAELPLAKAGPDKPLDLIHGLNPAWRVKVERFAVMVKPLLADPDLLTRDDWLTVQEAIAPFSKAVAAKPAPVAAPGVTVPPKKTVDLLGEERIAAILSSDLADRFADLARHDADGPAASTDIADMERLVLYYRHLHRLLKNFVNFSDFYTPGRKAAFQSGTLFIDGRACHLCMPAGDVEAHSAMAGASQIFLLYCECTRGRKPGEAEPEKKMNIVAAVTAGDSDLLVANRNGVYVDNNGDDWDARVLKVVSNPINVWQAVWSPYKKLGTLITDQLSKYANDKQADLVAGAGKKLGEVGTQVTAGAAPKFDITRNVGMFAAVGLALGAIGTAVGSIFNAFLSMEWWQAPLVFLAAFLLVSGPSVLMAWLKLRKRTLGPLLEASGWAINGRVKLSYAIAKRLSSTATMPPNSVRSGLDPVVRMQRLRRRVFWLAVATGAAAVLGWLAYTNYRSGRIDPAEPAAAVEAAPVEPEAEPPTEAPVEGTTPPPTALEP
ncbi:MAG: hypothetical protein LUC93_13515 [Planctomycetaceae bacterium]|nr:hypothetical protein [Planctomycetaceae bacterium]